MKTSKHIPRILFFAFLFVTLIQCGCAPSAQTITPVNQDVVQPTIQKSFGENLVEFILSVVGKKSKNVDELLVRDEL